MRRSVKFIHREYFEGARKKKEEFLCTLRKIHNVIAEARKDRQRYVQGPSKRRGRHRGHLIRGSIEAEVLLGLFVDGEYRCLRLLAHDFRRLYFEDPDDAPSYSTIVRFFHLYGYVRLVMERRHMLRDEEERLAFMIDVAHRVFDSLIFLDATLTTPNEFLEYYGWGLKGKKCIKTQFVINGRHFSVFALYCQFGFLAWKILEGDNTAEDFQEFLEDCREVISPGSHLILDNSSLHRTFHSLLKLNCVCR